MSCSTCEWQLRTPLYAHQGTAVEKLLPLKVGGLLMEMGTGKTRAAFELIHRRRRKVSRVVWACPASLLENTRRELLKHTTCPPSEIHVFGPGTDERHLPSAYWCIVSLEGIGSSARVVCTLDKLIDADTAIIVDESTYIKGPAAKRTRRLQILGRRARYKLVLTGTPITQGIEDLYSQMAFLSPKILGYQSWYTFAARHIRYDEKRPGRIIDRLGVEEVARKIAPYVYQIRKEECLDLPQKSYTTRWCLLTDNQCDIYQRVKDRFLEETLDADPADAGIAIYRLFSGLRAVACGVLPAGFRAGGCRRIDNRRVETLLDELAATPREHVVIWTNYLESTAEVVEALGKECPDRPVFAISGAVSPAGRVRLLDRWKTEAGILVATQGVGGHGLTLTEAAYVIFYSSGWKYSERLQAEDRCHRIGQHRNVLYTSIWADCGIDRRIADALEQKGDALQYLREQIGHLHVNRNELRDFVERL